MKQIIKTTEPESLVQHRANQPADYENLPPNAKKDLRDSLLSEQGYICCYCMKRIPEKVEKNGMISYNMKVEHYKCQDSFSELQLTYSNLSAACTGNEGQSKHMQTCDTKKMNSTELTINPTAKSPNCETLFKYNAEGEISSITGDTAIDKQLNEILNLNMQTLKDGRSEVYLEIQEKIKTESKKNKNCLVRYLQIERDKWLNRSENKYKPYCMVAVYYLNKKIRHYQNK